MKSVLRGRLMVLTLCKICVFQCPPDDPNKYDYSLGRK